MKKCPKCRLEFADNTLEFCLEDGSRLISELPTKTSVETVVLPVSDGPDRSPDADVPAKTDRTAKIQDLKLKAVEKGYKTLEVAPIVIALAHNYWQWIYADKHAGYSTTEFLLSANFVVWFVLLVTGLAFGILTLKFGRHKGFAVTALIVLAINVLLFVVPRR